MSVSKKNIDHQCKWSNTVYFNRKSTRKFRNGDNSGLIPTKMHNSLPDFFVLITRVVVIFFIGDPSLVGEPPSRVEIRLVFKILLQSITVTNESQTCIGNYKSFIKKCFYWFHVWPHLSISDNQ